MREAPQPAPLSAAARLEREARSLASVGNVSGAVALYIEAVKAGSSSPNAFSDLGALLAGQGHLSSAVVQFEMALVLDPHHRVARENLLKAAEDLSLSAFQGRRWAEAAAGYVRLTVLDPRSAVFQNNAAAALREIKQPEQALPHARRACELNPRSAIVHYNRGSVLFDLGEPSSEAAFLHAIELDPNHVDAHVNVALVYFRLGRLDTAESFLRRAIHLRSDPSEAPHLQGEAWGHLASVLRELGRLPESLACSRKAMALVPGSTEVAANYLLARQGDPSASGGDLLIEARDWARRFAEGEVAVKAASRDARFANRDRNPERRVRVGYVSADFREHAVARFIEPLWEAHDHVGFEWVAYSDSRPDDTTRRLRPLVDCWRETARLDDAQLTKQIQDDEIDILVDLAGHTGGNRLLCFARRPAPVQVTYCGFPGTTGLSTMDWRLTDAIADPVDEGNSHASERLWRLPRGFLCFHGEADQDEPPRAPPALSAGHVTFGSFNNLAKIGDNVLLAWAQILRRVPGSRLLMKSRALGESSAKRRIQDLLLAEGISSDRIEFVPYSPSVAEHRRLYTRVDVALDPFPYNGTTTTCEALWMGVPVVTLNGTRHAGRVGASLLSRVGLHDLVTADEGQYVERAIQLALSPEHLAGFRSDLRARLLSSDLMSASVVAKDIELAYRHFWRVWVEDNPINVAG